MPASAAKIKQLESLKQQNRQHNNLNHVLDDPEHPEPEYDLLKPQLHVLEKQYPE